MTIKVLMIDVDGVIVVHPHPQGWSVNLEKDLGLNRNTLQAAFFKPHSHDVVHGRAALRERLGPVLREIAPHLTCDQLIEYWFANDSNMNLNLLQQLGHARRCGFKLHLATVQEHERADFLWRKLGLRESTSMPFTMLQTSAGQSPPLSFSPKWNGEVATHLMRFFLSAIK